MTHKHRRMSRLGWIIGLVLTFATIAASAPATAKPAGAAPNILVFILDDVGIDQMKFFGYGGATAPRTPNIDAIASAGVGFRNFWTMPECSPSRAMLFEGRYPMRTNVFSAILSVDLANSQVSPYETTTPKILKQAGYTTGLFGKFHLTGSDVNPANNPLGYTAVHQLGWDYFTGWQDGAPHPIDTTAGGIADPNVTYACGFVPNTSDYPAGGGDTGACYLVDNTCSVITRNALIPTPGRACMERGGIFVRNTTCQTTRPTAVNFSLQNGYYAGQLVINQPNGSYQVLPPQDPSGAARGYRSILESQRAIGWINGRSPNVPWMATISYSAIHTPYQQPPTSMLPAGSLPTETFDCLGSLPDQRVLSNQMLEAMDLEIGRVLVETGLATRTADGSLKYDPSKTDTMIVLLGDNGTYAPSVKEPFNPLRAKANVYQTGVWTPLIVAGPLVKEPGRQVDAMVNVADVFELFGEFAGLDVHKIVPKSRPIDSVSMLPYLTNPKQKSLRSTNFTQTGTNIRPTGFVTPPCVIENFNTCIQLVASQELCGAEGGTWWGTGNDGTAKVGAGAPQPDCCHVNQYRITQQALRPYAVLSDFQMAMRDDDYKLVKKADTDYDKDTNSCVTTQYTELYAIDQSVPPLLDNKERDLLTPPHVLTKAEQKAFKKLGDELDKLLATEVPCPGDGNLDGTVDQDDLDQYSYWAATTGGKSSWYDFNLDGFTNPNDLPYITQPKFPRKCPKK